MLRVNIVFFTMIKRTYFLDFFLHNLTQSSQQSQESQQVVFHTNFKSGKSGLFDSYLTWLT